MIESHVTRNYKQKTNKITSSELKNEIIFLKMNLKQ